MYYWSTQNFLRCYQLSHLLSFASFFFFWRASLKGSIKAGHISRKPGVLKSWEVVIVTPIPKCIFPKCIFPKYIFPKCIFSKCVPPKFIFPKCSYPKCIFAKCTLLACLQSFASLFLSHYQLTWRLPWARCSFSVDQWTDCRLDSVFFLCIFQR